MRSDRLFLTAFLLAVLAAGPVGAGVLLDRVVATIDEEPVFLSEFREYRASLEGAETMPDQEILDRLINRKLLLMEARHLRLDRMGPGPIDDDALIERYVEFTVRPLVRRKWLRPGEEAEHRPDGGAPESGEGELAEKLRELRAAYRIRIQWDFGECGEGASGAP